MRRSWRVKEGTPTGSAPNPLLLRLLASMAPLGTGGKITFMHWGLSHQNTEQHFHFTHTLYDVVGGKKSIIKCCDKWENMRLDSWGSSRKKNHPADVKFTDVQLQILLPGQSTRAINTSNRAFRKMCCPWPWLRIVIFMWHALTNTLATWPMSESSSPKI